jgi:alpha-1,3-mannosyl-glycoprotein beta-1,2-N-acetylglucosaminyltransferase
MEISPDFFDYFAAFLPLLQADKTLYCISSWNDNGKHFRVNATDMFYRTDFFPGRRDNMAYRTGICNPLLLNIDT